MKKIKSYKDNTNSDNELIYNIMSECDYSKFNYSFIHKLNKLPDILLKTYLQKLSSDELKGVILECSLLQQGED